MTSPTAGKPRQVARGIRSEESEVEPLGFLGGAFGGAGTGVSDDHVGAGPAGEGHQTGLGSAGGAARRETPR